MNLNFTFKSFLLIFLSGLYSITITVGSDPSDDYTTIQDGIDAASDGDIVLVGDGTYTENLVIESDITLTSAGGHQNTVIDGSGAAAGTMGSTVTVRPESGSAVIPNNVEIDGFTITGGVGNSMNRNTPSGMVTGKFGGGIMAFNTSPKISNNDIKGNGSASTSNGGGIIAIDSAEDWSFNDREWIHNEELPPATDDLDFSNNIFYGNHSDYGHSVFIDGFEDFSTYLSNGIFDCYSTNYQDVSEYWVKGELTEFNYEGCDGVEPIYTEVWVDPYTGVDQGNYIGDIEHPFRTINFALGMVYSTEENPVNIYLAAGTFSPSINGESLPVNMISNINLIGQGEEITIIDAEGVTWEPGDEYIDASSRRPIKIEYCENNIISNLTLTGGSEWWPFSVDGGCAGGIYIDHSNPLIVNVTIRDNETDTQGGGVWMNKSNPTLSNVTIRDNDASEGGGIFIHDSTPIIVDVNIINNIADNGGGVLISQFESNSQEHPIFKNVTIANNVASEGGGIDFYDMDIIDFINVTIANNVADVGGGIFIHNYGLPMTFINSIIWGNFPQSIYAWELDGNPTQEYNISYSDIEGDFEGEGNIDASPLFVDPENGNYTLMGGSPCIDAGTADLDGDGVDDITDYFGEAPDMGAFEYMPNQQNGDLNGDGSVNIIDIVALVNIILNDLDTEGADFNGDGTVNVIDVVGLVQFVLNN